MKKKLESITIPVPYKRAGNVIYQQQVTFDVYRDDETFIAVPCLDGDELAIANLPTELSFILENGKPVSLRGKKDGNLHVIEDITAKLKEQQLLA